MEFKDFGDYMLEPQGIGPFLEKSSNATGGNLPLKDGSDAKLGEEIQGQPEGI